MLDPNLDRKLVDFGTYGDDARLHPIFTQLRAHDPVHRVEIDGFPHFWAVTKYADILEIERQQDRFLNDPLFALMPLEALTAIKAMTGGSHLVRMVVNMDNPDHRAYRAITQSWFGPANIKRIEGEIADLARRTFDEIEAQGGECDFVAVSSRFPLRVIMTILGLPPADEALMLRLTQELFGNSDPELRRGATMDDIRATVDEFGRYFATVTADRRANPREDVASAIANATIDGKPIGDKEAMDYYITIATAGHDTTASTIAGGMLALIEHPGELAKLRADPKLIGPAIDEMLRWVSPVRHFMRTAAEDYELRGRTIRKGDHLMMSYPSANRDEEVFADPFAFKVDRSPNRQVAFGYGPHVCLGQYLAKLELKAFFTELLRRYEVEQFTLNGTPAYVENPIVSGLKRLPIRYPSALQLA
jgi:cytochrome P450